MSARWPGNQTDRRGRGVPAKPLAEIHGRRGTYTNRGCRCDLCTEADRRYHREWRRQRAGYGRA